MSFCTTCSRPKAPEGRSHAVEAAYCTPESCDGYRLGSEPGTLFPDELAELDPLDPRRLEAVGCRVHFASHYEGVPPNRHPVTTDSIDSVLVRLPMEQWWHMTTREGDEYMGGCCGQASHIQDLFCDIHRDGGRIDARTLYELAAQVANHPDGFESWNKELTAENVDVALTRWGDLTFSGWTKLGVVWRLVKDKLIINEKTEPKARLKHQTEFDQARWAVASAVHFLNIRTAFSHKDDPPTPQQTANRLLTNARVWQPLKTVMAGLDAMTEVFKGFAIVDAESRTEVASNGYGLCLYETVEDAKLLLAGWEAENENRKEKGHRHDEDFASKYTIIPVEASVQHGLTLMPQNSPPAETEVAA